MGRPRVFTNASDRTRAWKLAHPERTRELNRASAQRWRERNPAALRQELPAYGITSDDYHQLFHAQNEGCAICGKAPTNRRLAIDHDHATGVIRGLLCQNCNTALGLFADSPERLRRAADYLVKSA